MLFEILAVFTDPKNELRQDFVTTFKSIVAQKYQNWKLVVIGNTEQITQTDHTITDFNNGSSLNNSIDLIKVKNKRQIDLNLALPFLGQNLNLNKPDTKLIIIKIGDYLSSNFLEDAVNSLKSLELSNEYLEPKLAYSDFKYLNSKQKIYDSNFILKRDFSQLKTSNFIFEPKFLLRPIQFFWDLGLIKQNDLKFDGDLPEFELQLAKFNLDYILALTELNGFLLPQAKFNPKSYYIATNELISTDIGGGTRIWKEILKTKKDVFEKIGGQIWWKYRLMSLL